MAGTSVRTLLLAAAMFAAASPCARADDVQVSGRVLPGHLAISAPQARVKVARYKARVADVLRVPFTVVDTRGNGAGWAVAMTATAQTARGVRVHGLALGVRGFRMHCSACTRPVDKIDYPLALPVARPTRVFRAAHRTGMGVIHLEAVVTIAGRPRPATGNLAVVVKLAQVSGP